MKSTKYITILTRSALLLGGMTLAAQSAYAADVSVNLVALESNATMPDGVVVPMWGFANDTGQACNSLPAWTVGPQISAVDNPLDTMTIHLRNCLPEAVSLLIPGQAVSGTPVWNGNRVRSLAGEAAANGGTATYTWTGLKSGTYLYQSGSHPALQVPMGLYGAMVVDAGAAGTSYAPSATNADTDYTNEVLLLYSEIDVDLHNPPGVAQPLNYIPEYYLINGLPYQGDIFLAGSVGESTLIRFLNAGLKTHVPTLLNAPYMQLIAEDGNLYPYAKEQYTVPLAAGKTMDAIWHPTTVGTFPLVDGANYLTSAGATGGGMLAQLQVGAASGGGSLAAVNDSATVAEGGMTTINLLGNDTGAVQVVLVSSASFGVLTLNPDGTVNYTHDGGQSTADSFTYKALDASNAESNLATVNINITPVNDAPVAMGDSYNTTAGSPLSVSAPGVLGNDSDPDGDALTAVQVTGVSGGSLTLNGDGSFTYTANIGTTSDSFTYSANDGTVNSAPVSVNFTVTAPVASAPVAVDDYASTPRNRAVNINMVANDTDADSNLLNANGNVNAGRITIVSAPTRGGTVTTRANGVRYVPPRGYRGTDVFTYTVTDLSGLISNVATVRVNIN